MAVKLCAGLACAEIPHALREIYVLVFASPYEIVRLGLCRTLDHSLY